MGEDKSDLLQGTLDLLILRTLATGPRHGWGISQRIQQLSNEVLRVNQGSLYPALYRLEARGWIAASWELSDKGKRARYYRITAKGKVGLNVMRAEWQNLIAAMDQYGANGKNGGRG